MPSGRITFITGTDTGVGKTVLTSLLLAHLRTHGIHALGAKPFCSGSRSDVAKLGALQDGELTFDEINPFFFGEPIASLAAARLHRRSVPFLQVVQHLEGLARRCERLLVEGAGGLLAPLGEDTFRSAGKRRSCAAEAREAVGKFCARRQTREFDYGFSLGPPVGRPYTLLDLLASIGGDVLVVARNRLGTINHTLLTARVLKEVLYRAPLSGAKLGKTDVGLKVALMGQRASDPSSESNAQIIAESLAPVVVESLPFLGVGVRTAAQFRSAAARTRRILDRLARP